MPSPCFSSRWKYPLNVRQSGRELEILADGNSEQLLEQLQARQPEELRCDALTLEEIFVAAGTLARAGTAARLGKPEGVKA